MSSFTKKPKSANRPSDEPESAELYEQIGRLKVQLECFKKKWPKTVTEARAWIDFGNPELSVREQCRLLGIQRRSIYYEPQPETEENLQFMRLMDETHLKHPARGSRQMVDFLEDQGFYVNGERVQRLMQKSHPARQESQGLLGYGQNHCQWRGDDERLVGSAGIDQSQAILGAIAPLRRTA